MPISHSQDTAGPMTAERRDAADVAEAMADPKRAGRLTTAAPEGRALKGARLGVARFIQGFSPPTERHSTRRSPLLKAQGAELVVIEKFDLAHDPRTAAPDPAHGIQGGSQRVPRDNARRGNHARSRTSSRSICGATRAGRRSARTCSNRRRPRPASMTRRTCRHCRRRARLAGPRGHRSTSQGSTTLVA